MTAAVEYRLNTASEAEIVEHLSRCDAAFVPTLSGRVEINGYAKKIASNAMRFEALVGDSLVGLVAAYCNDQDKGIAYITSVSVLREWMGNGIAACLMKQCIEHVKASGILQISLEVSRDNTPAISLYEKSGFVAGNTNGPLVSMHLYLKSGKEHEQ